MEVIRDISKLKPKMRKVAEVTLSIIRFYDLPFAIFETLRTKERQLYLYNKGNTQTLKSRHIIGEAFDVVAKDKRGWTWNYDKYIKEWYMLAFMIQMYAKVICKCTVVWGGEWSFKDFPHFQYGGKIG